MPQRLKKKGFLKFFEWRLEVTKGDPGPTMYVFHDSIDIFILYDNTSFFAILEVAFSKKSNQFFPSKDFE